VKYLPNGDDGPGYYLVIVDEPDSSEAGNIYKFFYYRTPTIDDTDLIKNTTILKTGVRAQAGAYNPNAPTDLGIYLRMKSGFVEDPLQHAHHLIVRPSRRAQRHNRLMHQRGQGQ